MDINGVYVIAFWVCLAMLVVGMVLGITAIWLPDIFHNAYKLFLTGAIVFGGSLAITIITRFLR